MATNKKINELKRAESESSETQAGSSASATPTLSRTPTGELMQTTVTLSRPDGEAQEAMSTTIEHEVAAKVRLDEDSGRLHLYNAKRAPKVKRLVTFRPQLSSFDRFNPNTSTDLFRGFYTLFWIFLAIMVIRTGLKSWHEERTIVGMTFARLIGSDGLVLALSDLALVSSTILCVPFMQVRGTSVLLLLLFLHVVLTRRAPPTARRERIHPLFVAWHPAATSGPGWLPCQCHHMGMLQSY